VTFGHTLILASCAITANGSLCALDYSNWGQESEVGRWSEACGLKKPSILIPPESRKRDGLCDKLDGRFCTFMQFYPLLVILFPHHTKTITVSDSPYSWAFNKGTFEA
jgi:hypothetical protein